jgi:hypothetical protein
VNTLPCQVLESAVEVLGLSFDPNPSANFVSVERKMKWDCTWGHLLFGKPLFPSLPFFDQKKEGGNGIAA